MQINDFVRISFEGKLKETGQKFDGSEDIPAIVAEGYNLKGVEEILAQMKVGEKKTVDVTPEKGFGKRNSALVKLVPIAEFRRHGTKPVPGMTVDADNRRGKVLSVSGGRVRVDFNHPLAGKILVYTIEIKEKIETPENKIKSLLEIFTRKKDDIKVKIDGKEAEIRAPPFMNSLIKKRIADESMKFIELERVKFVEVFEKRKEEHKPEEKKEL